ncbi:MAG: DNA mismatch repair endonuclease MutL [Lachnospiraceae bacterium]|nr:DNA mismatch repair endonuclease MutL [Lachnospiraceae bacterium]
MGSIKLLDKDTINKIAAGEVVERPASVVKELIENSIDSGADIITCEIKEGGKSYIRISDNGSGFEKDDIKLAFLRHSTSKISCEEDLEHIKSLGFRGEALSSISSVSKLELLSKKKDDFLGNRYVIEGGAEKSFSEAGCPDGTTIIVRELFFNTPARRKFLKSTNTEAGYISDIVNRLAISHPEISFRFINQGKTILFTNGNGNEKDALYQIYGRDVASNLIKIDYNTDAFSVNGYVGKPAILRGNRICENYYINGRYSKSAIITKSIEEAYKGYAMHNKYPFTSLHFVFPLEKLDINVHPAKMEVRIADGDFYYAKIFQLVSDALHSSNLIVDATIGKETKSEAVVTKPDFNSVPQSFEEKRLENTARNLNLQKDMFGSKNEEDIIREKPVYSVKIDQAKENDLISNASGEKDEKLSDYHKEETNIKETISTIVSKPYVNNVPDNFEQLSFIGKENFLKEENLVKHRIVGQVFGTYWIVEMDDNMFMIDQHAAHEKVLYERTMKRYKEDRMGSQALFPSLIVTLSLSEVEVLNRYMDYFTRLGFEIESFGDREYQISAVPVDLFDYSSDVFFHDILDQLTNSPLKGEIDIVINKIATMSCKAAIKGNTRISTAEAEALIKELLSLENPYHCPHGRPVIISMSKYEIEKKFKRIL